MELSHIQSFLAVARHENITRAAESLLLTQPAVTLHIQALEREFETALFDRTGRGMRLTAAGKALERHFEDALKCLNRAKSLARDIQSGLTGHLAIGSALSPSTDGVTKCVCRMHQEHPNVKLSLRVARSEAIAAMILEEQLDVGIASVARSPKGLFATPLFTQHFVLVAAPTHPLAGKMISADQVSRLQLVGCMGGPWVGIESGVSALQRLAPAIEADTLLSIKALVVAGLGCALLPEHNVIADLKAGQLRQVRVRSLPMPSRVVSLIRRRAVSETGAVSAFVAIARRLFAKGEP